MLPPGQLQIKKNAFTKCVRELIPVFHLLLRTLTRLFGLLLTTTTTTIGCGCLAASKQQPLHHFEHIGGPI